MINDRLVKKAFRVKTDSPVAKSILVYMAAKADINGEFTGSSKEVYLGCEIGKTSFFKHVKALECQGYLKIIRMAEASGALAPSRYIVLGGKQ